MVDLVIEKSEKLADFCTKSELPYYMRICWPLYAQQKARTLYPREHNINRPEIATPVWKAINEECIKLSKALKQVHPLVIDNFLGQNPTLAPIGKLLIAWVILECESQAKEKSRDGIKRNINRNYTATDWNTTKDDWCRFILHRLAQLPKKLKENKITFVTFNYDVSLERELYESLNHIEEFDKNEIKDFIYSNVFLHMYGKIHATLDEATLPQRERDLVIFLDRDQPYDEKPLTEMQNILNISYKASEEIFTIEECEKKNGDKNNCEEIHKLAKERIKNAKHIYILGFGFDERNIGRLELEKFLRDPKHQQMHTAKRVYFTNYGNKNIINKKASKLFLKRPDRFLPPQYIQSPSMEPRFTKYSYYEKSIKDVYQALEEDFDFLMIE